MKNKKILARIFALTMTVALVFALAIPCFAAEPTVENFDDLIPHGTSVSALEEFLVFSPSVYDYDYLTYGRLYDEQNNCMFVHGEDIPFGDSFLLQCDLVIAYDSPDGMWALFVQGALVISTFADTFVTVNIIDTQSGGLVCIVNYDIVNADAPSIEGGLDFQFNNLTFNTAGSGRDDSVTNASLISICLGAQNETLGFSNNLAQLLFGPTFVAVSPYSYSVGFSSASDSAGVPVRSGMYGQLYDILRDAIFGKGVTLDNTQDYALTLLATVMSYVTVLAPVILVVFIVVWCFKRF